MSAEVVDEKATKQVLALRGRVGGYNDPLPGADPMTWAVCEDCGLEHTTYAAYRQAHADEHAPGHECRLCLGCVARQTHQARPTNPPALLPGTCEEFAK